MLSILGIIVLLFVGIRSHLGVLLPVVLVYAIWQTAKLRQTFMEPENAQQAEDLWIEANRPRVFAMPYLAGCLPALLRPKSDDPNDARYRKLLQSKFWLSVIVFFTVTPLLGYWLIHLISQGAKRAIPNDTYSSMFALCFYFCLVQFRNIRTELSTFKHYDRWVAQGCPKSVDLS
ncbi:MAG: hypothetical protein JST51_05195 [Armatimonadetes bacterium]|nr:hypothetical protein [Armatimonadota bacterium]